MTGVMPDRCRNDATECHRQHKLPCEIHHLIDAGSRQSPADPDENEEQDRQLREEPDIRGNKTEERQWRMPSTEKQSHREAADREHADVFGHEKVAYLKPEYSVM